MHTSLCAQFVLRGVSWVIKKVFVRANLFIGLRSINFFFWGAQLLNCETYAVITPLNTLAKRCKRHLPLLAAPAALLLIQGQALASTRLVTFPFNNNADGNNGFNYSTFDSSRLTAATVAKGPGLGQYSVSTDGLTPNVQVLKTGPGSTISAATAADALSNDWYFTIALTPNGSMSIDSINLDWTRGGTTGVRGWFVRSSLDNYASNLYSNETPNGTAKGLQPASISLSGFTGLTAQTDFRFYIHTTTSGRYMDFSNISVQGSGPVAVPGPLPLLGAVAAFGWSRRLRKRLATPLSKPPQA